MASTEDLADEMMTGAAARWLDVSAERVRQLNRAGVLEARWIGGVRIFRAAAVEALRRQREKDRRTR